RPHPRPPRPWYGRRLGARSAVSGRHALSETRDELAEQYRRALRDYLDDAGETALARAYELGRNAVVDGLGVLEMAALHHEALRASVLRLAAFEARAKAPDDSRLMVSAQ